MSTRYRQIEVSGPPRELGRQIGEAAREEIRGFAAIALERVNKTVRCLARPRHGYKSPEHGLRGCIRARHARRVARHERGRWRRARRD